MSLPICMTTSLTNIVASVNTNVWVNKNVGIRSDLGYIRDKILKVLKVVLESQIYNAKRDLPKIKIKQK